MLICLWAFIAVGVFYVGLVVVCNLCFAFLIWFSGGSTCFLGWGGLVWFLDFGFVVLLLGLDFDLRHCFLCLDCFC